MIEIGNKIPDFEGINQNGTMVKSSDFLGKKLVIFFYPKANTPGCTAEACNLNENYNHLKNNGYQILGISADSVEKQKKFHEKYDFQYDLIADENREIIEKFGVWQPKKFMGRAFMGIVRTTFLFDEKGICTEVITKVKTKDHTAQIIK